jgi:predicted Fe-Mo cluster-binding NifX family protein
MEYYETNDFFDSTDTEKIMEMAVSKRVNYINPLVAPEVMKNALAYFKNKDYRIYSQEYFTAKNVVTGVIKKTNNTYTVHHFVTQYHSEEWKKNRENEQKIIRSLGENTKLSKIFLSVYKALQHLKRHGFLASMRYYIGRFILRNRDWGKIDF